MLSRPAYQSRQSRLRTPCKSKCLTTSRPTFKNYLTVVNDRIQKDEKLEDDEILFKAIEEEETQMKAEQKASANFASAKSKSQGNAPNFTERPNMCKKCGCKHLTDLACRHANDKCDKCHKKRGIFLGSMTVTRHSTSLPVVIPAQHLSSPLVQLKPDLLPV